MELRNDTDLKGHPLCPVCGEVVYIAGTHLIEYPSVPYLDGTGFVRHRHCLDGQPKGNPYVVRRGLRARAPSG
jgi:hypothetical protein